MDPILHVLFRVTLYFRLGHVTKCLPWGNIIAFEMYWTAPSDLLNLEIIEHSSFGGLHVL